MSERFFKRTRREIDLALELVQGCRPAAAKLLDLEEDELRNRINNCARLKARWKKPAGRQKPELKFFISPYDRQLDPSQWEAQFFTNILSRSSKTDIEYVKEWLQSR